MLGMQTVKNALSKALIKTGILVGGSPGVVQYSWKDAGGTSRSQNFYQDASSNIYPMHVVSDGLGDILFLSGNPGFVNLSQVGGGAFGLGQQLASACLPVVLTAAQIASLTGWNPSLAAGSNLIGQTSPVPTAKVDILFAPSGGQVTIPSTPSAYTNGYVIGGNITLTGMGRANALGGLITDVELIEELGSSALSGTSVSYSSSTSEFTLTGTNTLVNGNKVKFAGTVPGGITAGVSYYVVNVSGLTFQVSPTVGGSPVTLTTTSSCTVSEVPQQMVCNLYIFQSNPTVTNDNAIYAPSSSDIDPVLPTVSISSYSLSNQQAVATAGYVHSYLCGSGTTSMYAFLVFNGTTGQVLSKQATLKLRIWLNPD